MKVKVKLVHPDSVMPSYSKQGDAGMDLTAVSFRLKDDIYIEYDTGVAVEIPEGYVGLVFPRSSISDQDLSLSNSVGVIDSGYRNSIKCRFKVSAELVKKGSRSPYHYKKGDRICQLIILPYPHIELEEVDELSSTERNTGGFGSSGL